MDRPRNADEFIRPDHRSRLRIATINAAASDQQGTATLHRTVMNAASSMIEPDSDKDWMRVTDRIEIKTDTVDHAIPDLGNEWSLPNFNVMRLNIQGAELLALRGAPETLQHVDVVYMEIDFDYRYPTSPTSTQLEEFLASHGFMPAERYRYDGKYNTVGDIIFLRNRSKESRYCNVCSRTAR